MSKLLGLLGGTTSLRRRLLLSHLLVALIGVAFMVCAVMISNLVRSHVIHLATMRSPTAVVSYSLAHSVQKSLADLRGWVALGDASFRTRRELIWQDEILPNLERLRRLSQQWPDAEDKQQLTDLESLLVDLREAQWWNEEVANTPGNFPATLAYEKNCRPIARDFDLLIGVVIQHEKGLESSARRKRLLAKMGEVHNHVLRAHAQLSGFLVSADHHRQKTLLEELEASRKALDDLILSPGNFSRDQFTLLTRLKEELKAYIFYADEVMKVRMGQHWDQISFWMERETVPLSNQVSGLLQTLADSHATSLFQEAAEVTDLSNHTFYALVILVPLLAILVCLLSSYLGRVITRPVEDLTDATRKIRSGDWEGNLAVRHQDEIGRLTEDFNAMMHHLFEAEQGLREKTIDLAKALDSKEILFKELNHRVKNNLQVVSSLLDLQAISSGDSQVSDILQECRSRVHSMALIHETLYKGIKHTNIDLAVYLQRLGDDLFESFGGLDGRIHYNFHAENISLTLDKAIPCGLILNELLTNAFKYAFPENRSGCIRVEAAVSEGGLELSIQDDGVGFSRDLAGQSDSLGMTIIETLAGQLDAEYSFLAGLGTGFKMRFALA